MEKRNLKVYYSWNRNRQVPRIQLQGAWLEHIGFFSGDKLKIEYQPGQIIITKANAEASTDT